MCGICGVVGGDPTLAHDAAESLNAAQLHRGPDHQAVVHDHPFHLGSTRLAIQDPHPRANQPMRSADGRLTLVMNGEIYNHRELARRHSLVTTTTCDAEVLLRLWERMGSACLPLLRGMFAVAVADVEEGRVYLARGPFGIKPLYWRRFGGGIAFASEAKPLWLLDRTLPLDPAALADFLAFGAVGVERSPWREIVAVGPGSCISFDATGAPRTEQRVDAIDCSREAGAGSTTAILGEAFRDSVRAHLEADVPSALLLSAGVDSTLIALAARDLGVRLQCLTVTGASGEDESWQARATAREYGHEHVVVPAEFHDEDVEQFFAAMQRPTIDGLNTFLVCRAVASAGFKVALSGLGGDEALGGYTYSRILRALPLLALADRVAPGRLGVARDQLVARSVPPGKTRRLLTTGGPRTAGGVVVLSRELFGADVAEQLLHLRCAGQWQPNPEPESFTPRQTLMVHEVHRYLQPMLLQDADAFSMTSAVEVRVPFVDVPFFNVALRAASAKRKRVLVAAMGDPYLSRLSRRPKSGFDLPMGGWMGQGTLRQVVAAARSPQAPVWDHVDRTRGLRILDQDASRGRWSEPWAIAALDGWLRSLS